MISSAEITGGRGNPFSAIGANAFRTTNRRSQSTMRGTEFHGNTGRDGQPAYPVYLHTHSFGIQCRVSDFFTGPDLHP